MKNDKKITLFLVDDDAVFLKLLAIEFQHNTDFTVETFPTGERCLARMTAQQPDVIVLDYHLDSIDTTAMNGLATLDKIKADYPKIPVMMLSSQDKIEVAVNCMHHKALDYIVKSETSFLRIQKNINAYFHYEKIESELNWYMARM